MLCLYIQAPFAACRTFTTGAYRPTATFLTPSAAYGLILNVAFIETRLREEESGHDGTTPASLMRPGLPPVEIGVGTPAPDPPRLDYPQQHLPAVEIAVGVPAFQRRRKAAFELGEEGPFPNICTVYQQLHNYMVGGKDRVDDPSNPGEKTTKEKLGLLRTKQNKWNIAPVRREVLCGLRAVVCLRGNEDLEDRVRRGLRGEFNSDRYGLPFLGDNAFLLDRLEERIEPPPAHWFERVTGATAVGPRPRTTRLTIWIDRADMSRTISSLFAPTDHPTEKVPEAAWTPINPPSAPPLKPARGRTVK